MVALGCRVVDLAHLRSHDVRGDEDAAGAALSQAAGEDVVVAGQHLDAVDRPHLGVVRLLEADDVLDTPGQRAMNSGDMLITEREGML